MKRCEADHLVFYCQTSPGKCVFLVVYVDDIVITGNDNAKDYPTKRILVRSFSD